MIELVEQEESGCVLACIAMVSGLPLDDVNYVYHKLKGKTAGGTGGVTMLDELWILDHIGLTPILQSSAASCLGDNRVYLVTVPSRTKEGTHRIVIDYKFFQDSIKVYDPVKEEFLRYTDFSEVRNVFYDVVEIPYMMEYCYKYKEAAKNG